MDIASTKPLLRALNGEVMPSPPWWLMRQAGRYLPEYRAVRSKARGFIELCLTPSLAAEVTLQPIRRYGMDGAILFSDILMLPQALGQKLAFREGEGPILEPIRDAAGLRRLEPAKAAEHLAPIRETIDRVRSALDPKTTLLGFAGAPWTVATYMVEGGASRDFHWVKGWAYRDPAGFGALIDLLTESTIEMLTGQIEAGVEVVQLFDSWAGILPRPEFERWVIEPSKRIVSTLKMRYPDCPIIGFPRGAGVLYQRYARDSGVDAVSLDTTVPPEYAAAQLQTVAAIQGNLDPVLLLTGGEALAAAVAMLRRALSDGPWVFNLGHGVLPQTPPEHVTLLADLLAEPGAAG
jgi:uroporphyrinogen decarboxylase